jgi:hypothetical protein
MEFGTFLADGEKAAAFRYARIDPFIHSHEQIILDFQGIRNINSSFANALIANLVSQSPEVLSKLHFININPRGGELPPLTFSGFCAHFGSLRKFINGFANAYPDNGGDGFEKFLAS